MRESHRKGKMLVGRGRQEGEGKGEGREREAGRVSFSGHLVFVCREVCFLFFRFSCTCPLSLFSF